MSKFNKDSKILYLSDGYARKVRGTKVSIFQEMKYRGFNITFQNIHMAGKNRVNGARLLNRISTERYDWIWVAHTWVRYMGCTLKDINRAGAAVLGFGFSDPYRWDPDRLDQYNFYATNHFETADNLQREDRMPVTMFCTAGDRSFHRDMNLARDVDILVFGIGQHPHFNPKDYRLQVVRQLMEEFPDRVFRIHGDRWGDLPTRGPIVGQDFLKAINRSQVSLDLQQPHAPLAHRMFECMMCGTPVITRNREEVRRIFNGQKGPFFYETVDDLILRIVRVLDGNDWDDLSRSVREVSEQYHDIARRVDTLLAWLESLT